MVDSISGQTPNTNVSGTRLNSSIATGISSPSPTEKEPIAPALTPSNQVATANSVGTSPAVTLLVSKESQEKANQDLAVAKLVRKANAVKEPYNQEKVEHFKQLLKNPQALTQYLESVDTHSIANSILTNVEGQLFS